MLQRENGKRQKILKRGWSSKCIEKEREGEIKREKDRKIDNNFKRF